MTSLPNVGYLCAAETEGLIHLKAKANDLSNGLPVVVRRSLGGSDWTLEACKSDRGTLSVSIACDPYSPRRKAWSCHANFSLFVESQVAGATVLESVIFRQESKPYSIDLLDWNDATNSDYAFLFDGNFLLKVDMSFREVRVPSPLLPCFSVSSPSFTDVILVVEGEQFHANRNQLMSASSVFHCALHDGISVLNLPMLTATECTDLLRVICRPELLERVSNFPRLLHNSDLFDVNLARQWKMTMVGGEATRPSISTGNASVDGDAASEEDMEEGEDSEEMEQEIEEEKEVDDQQKRKYSKWLDYDCELSIKNIILEHYDSYVRYMRTTKKDEEDTRDKGREEFAEDLARRFPHVSDAQYKCRLKLLRRKFRFVLKQREVKDLATIDQLLPHRVAVLAVAATMKRDEQNVVLIQATSAILHWLSHPGAQTLSLPADLSSTLQTANSTSSSAISTLGREESSSPHNVFSAGHSDAPSSHASSPHSSSSPCVTGEGGIFSEAATTPPTVSARLASDRPQSTLLPALPSSSSARLTSHSPLSSSLPSSPDRVSSPSFSSALRDVHSDDLSDVASSDGSSVAAAAVHRMSLPELETDSYCSPMASPTPVSPSLRNTLSPTLTLPTAVPSLSTSCPILTAMPSPSSPHRGFSSLSLSEGVPSSSCTRVGMSDSLSSPSFTASGHTLFDGHPATYPELHMSYQLPQEKDSQDTVIEKAQQKKQRRTLNEGFGLLNTLGDRGPHRLQEDQETSGRRFRQDETMRIMRCEEDENMRKKHNEEIDALRKKHYEEMDMMRKTRMEEDSVVRDTRLEEDADLRDARMKEDVQMRGYIDIVFTKARFGHGNTIGKMSGETEDEDEASSPPPHKCFAAKGGSTDKGMH